MTYCRDDGGWGWGGHGMGRGPKRYGMGYAAAGMDLCPQASGSTLQSECVSKGCVEVCNVDGWGEVGGTVRQALMHGVRTRWHGPVPLIT